MMGDIEKRGPLQGLRVLDLTRVLSGPFATMWLATMGADVVKIENPKDGDVTRDYKPEINGRSAYFPTVNHNKKCITLNLKTQDGKELFKEMVKDYDVVIENFRPGVMDKLGLGYEILRDINPGIIYASISGYGTYGPYKNRPGYDVTAQAISGIMYLTGQAGGEPTRVGSSIGDTVAGISAIVAILAALYNKNATGKGEMVEVSLVDSLISLSTQDYIRYFAAGEVPTRMGNIYKTWTPYGTYKTKGGYYNLGVGTNKHFRKFANAIGKPEIADDYRFLNHQLRVEYRQELDDIINEWSKNYTKEEICELMVKNGVPCEPVNSIVEISTDKHIDGAREMFPILEQKGIGPIKITNIPVKFSRSGLAALKSSSDMGEDNEEVYGMMGKTVEELKRLREEGVI